MAPEEAERIYRLLESQGNRLDKTNERLAAIEEAMKHPAPRPCSGLVELREQHRGLLAIVSSHIATHAAVSGDVRKTILGVIGSLAAGAIGSGATLLAMKAAGMFSRVPAG